MKKLIALLFCTLTLNLFGQQNQETEVKTDISDVTVYFNGAQITRSKTIDVAVSRSTIKFINLSPYIDAKSINVNVKGDLTVLSVNHQLNFLSKENKSKEAEQLSANKKEIEKKINLENAYLEVLKEETAFLKANHTIGGANTGTSINSLKDADTFLSEKLTNIKLKEIERQNTIEQLNKELEKVTNQLNALSAKKELPSGEILVTIDAKSNAKATFEIKYVVSNAGWLPSYDIRVKNIEQPANLAYKANIHQNTNEDWKNVKLKLSSADPNSSGTFMDLKTYFLNYSSAPPSYNSSVSQVSGHVYDANNQPLPGTTIMIKGTSIGTISDGNGFYTLSVPQNSRNLVASFVGMKSKELMISNSQIDIVLEEQNLALNEVVVVGYGRSKQGLLGNAAGAVRSLASRNLNKTEIKSADQESIPIEIEQTSNQTTVEFEIKTPYSISSNGKSITVEIENYSLPANYQYYSTPKIDKSAYLLAEIVDWEKYNLLEGEANVFFEDTYTGKTLLDVRYMSDTLKVSLGKDKGVSVNRVIQKQFTTKQFLGNKQEETKSWLISVKNNKQQNINLSIIDQIPVSTLEEIEVNPVSISNGKLDPTTGKIVWTFQLKPTEKKDIDLKYAVRSPKSKRLVIE